MLTHLYSAAMNAAGRILPLARPFLPARSRRWWEGVSRSHRLLDGCPRQADVWVHCASLGEYEQAAPLIEALRQRRPRWKILLTFFSPSGYDKLKDRSDLEVHYLPLDTPRHMRQWVDFWRPRWALFVKYEFWQNALLSLARAGVPTYLVAGVFRPSSPYFSWAAGFYRRLFRAFSGFMVQDRASAAVLRRAGFSGVWVTGDPRIDRVAAFAPDPEVVTRIRHLMGDGPVLIGGSTYPPEERILQAVRAHFPELSLIIAPHDVSPDRIDAVRRRFPAARCWSENPSGPAPVLILDRVGLLKSAYFAADIALIGGGLHARIHNVLEPAAAGLPIFFGPRHHDFAEADALIRAGAALVIRNADEMIRRLPPLLDARHRSETGRRARDFIDTHRGATRRILHILEEKGLLADF